jgi:hypothetical protein
MQEYRNAGIKEYKNNLPHNSTRLRTTNHELRTFFCKTNPNPITSINDQLLTINYFAKRTQSCCSRSALLRHLVHSRAKNADIRPPKRTQFPDSQGLLLYRCISHRRRRFHTFALFLLPFAFFSKRTHLICAICEICGYFFPVNPVKKSLFQNEPNLAARRVHYYVTSCVLAPKTRTHVRQNEPNFSTPPIYNIQFPIYNRKNEPNLPTAEICFMIDNVIYLFYLKIEVEKFKSLKGLIL